MANAFFNLYKGAPTAGGTDGTAISTGDNTAPLTFTLDATQNESASETLAVRCESGYETCADAVITFVGDTNNHWQISKDGENWNDSITFTDKIEQSNLIFYVKASADSSENPSNDTSVKIRVSTKIAAV